LEIGVRTNGSTVFTSLPRQSLTATPQALYAVKAAEAVTAQTAAGVATAAVGEAGLANRSVTLSKINTNGALAGQVISFDGNAAIWQTPSGDITEVVAGPGLNGGAAAGIVNLEVAFAGTGSATTAARSDHTHPALPPNFNTLTGGSGNSVSSGPPGFEVQYSTISGGHTNSILGGFDPVYDATIAGGAGNTIFPLASGGVIGGGIRNRIESYQGGSTIAGGTDNAVLTSDLMEEGPSVGARITRFLALRCRRRGTRQSAPCWVGDIGGGAKNQGYYNFCTISGGATNEARGPYATIGGGSRNSVTEGNNNTIAGGFHNGIAGPACAPLTTMPSMGAPIMEIAASLASVIAGGQENGMSADPDFGGVQYCVVSGGFSNRISGFSDPIFSATIAGGYGQCHLSTRQRWGHWRWAAELNR
jgi:hypothetical protein